MKKIKLSNGVEMPQLGYGVYQVEPDECERCVLDALSVGYRMIDTAQAYLNEEAVGNAWKKSGVNRDEIFLVSKVWPSNYGDGQTMKSIDESLRKLQTDYIDLMLLHQPYCDRYGAYRDLEKAYKAGKVRAIGVSNFFPDHLIDLASNMEIAPMVNQMETHVFNQQHETRKFMDEFGTKLMAWAPLAEGQNGLFTNPTLTQIGEKYGKTANLIKERRAAYAHLFGNERHVEFRIRHILFDDARHSFQERIINCNNEQMEITETGAGGLTEFLGLDVSRAGYAADQWR